MRAGDATGGSAGVPYGRRHTGRAGSRRVDGRYRRLRPGLDLRSGLRRQEKGYFAEQGLDVTLEPLPGGSDLVALTASGELDAGIGGAGPAFWNAIAQGLPI